MQIVGFHFDSHSRRIRIPNSIVHRHILTDLK